jgi:hypothetical protein
MMTNETDKQISLLTRWVDADKKMERGEMTPDEHYVAREGLRVECGEIGHCRDGDNPCIFCSYPEVLIHYGPKIPDHESPEYLRIMAELDEELRAAKARRERLSGKELKAG